MTELVTYNRSDLVSTLTIDDGKVNVFSIPMLRALHEAFDEAERDETVVLLRGRPGYFSAGFDLGVFNSGVQEDALLMLTLGATLAERILTFPAPVVVACTGHAFPAGAFLLMAADTRIGADGPFKLGLNEVRIGLTLPWFAIALARHRLTPSHFDHATVTGSMFDPPGAREAGLLDAVVGPDELDAVASVRRRGARRGGPHRACRHQAPGAPARPRGAAGGHRGRAHAHVTAWDGLRALDTRRHSAHDQDVDNPSLFETVIDLPETLLRLPASTLQALDAVSDLSEKLDRLMPLLERIDGGVNRAGSGIDLAALGISTAVSGLETTVATLDASLPSLSESASILRSLAEGLGMVATELASELPKATRSLQELSPELGAIVGLLDERFAHLDGVVTDMGRLMEAAVGTIPGIRRVLRVTTTSSTPL